MNSKPYTALHVISQATDQIAEQIEVLRDEGLLLPDFAAIRKATAQLLCSDIRITTILRLEPREQKESARLEQERKENQPNNSLP